MGRPVSDGMSLTSFVASGVKRLMRRSWSRKIVAISVLLSRFCMSSLVRARSSTLA